MSNLEILRQLSPLNVIAISFLLKNIIKYRMQLDPWLLSMFFLLSLNLFVSRDIEWSLAMMPRVLFLVFCCRISASYIKELEPNFLIKTIFGLVFCLFPFALIEVIGHKKIFFTGQYGLPAWDSKSGISITHIDRLWSTLGQPNITGMFYAFAAIFTLRQILYDGKKSQFKFFIFACSTGLVYFTGSRSAFLGLIIGLCWLVLFRIKEISRQTIAWIPLFLILLIPTTQVVSNASSFLTTFGFARSSVDASKSYEVRTIIWKDSDFFTNIPFFGTGQGYSAKYYAETGHRYILENSLFQIFISFGFLLGGVLIVILTLAILKSLPLQNIPLIFPVLTLLASSNAWEGIRNLQTFMGVLILLGRVEFFDSSRQN